MPTVLELLPPSSPGTTVLSILSRLVYIDDVFSPWNSLDKKARQNRELCGKGK